MTENDVAKQIVDAAFKVHTTLGPGLLESVYEAAMAYEFNKRRLQFVRQVQLPVTYEGEVIADAFRADFIVEHLVIVEIKSVEGLAPVHKKQLLTYLRLNKKRLGLLINFGEELIRHGISRVANGLEEQKL